MITMLRGAGCSVNTTIIGQQYSHSLTFISSLHSFRIDHPRFALYPPIHPPFFSLRALPVLRQPSRWQVVISTMVPGSCYQVNPSPPVLSSTMAHPHTRKFLVLSAVVARASAT